MTRAQGSGRPPISEEISDRVIGDLKTSQGSRVWEILTEKVAECRCKLQTRNELKQLLLKQWTNVSLQEVRNICASCGKRLLAVQVTNGGHVEHTF